VAIDVSHDALVHEVAFDGGLHVQHERGARAALVVAEHHDRNRRARAALGVRRRGRKRVQRPDGSAEKKRPRAEGQRRQRDENEKADQ
jgi:hypothetical protein